MIRQTYKSYPLHSAFALILTIVLVGTFDSAVRSQPAGALITSTSSAQPGPETATSNRPLGLGSVGGLDSNFGDRGRLTVDFGTDEAASAIAVQADGKMVVAGTLQVGGCSSYLYADCDFVVFRYNADGSLDAAFDGDGKLTTAIGDGNDSAYTVAIQADGKIIVAGVSITSNGNFRAALVRYNTDGSLDPSFGSGGKVLTPGWAITDIVLQPDGKIVAARDRFSVARYNVDGSLDASFGVGGSVFTNFEGNVRGASSVSLQADGRIVAAGYAGLCEEKGGCFYNFALARYNTDGSPDTSFGTEGRLTTAFVNYDFANDVAIQADGKIVAAGYASGLAVARYNGDGSLDTSFDGDGKVTLPTFGAGSVVLQPDGKLVVCGGNGDFALIRLNADGSLDSSFDGDGTVTTDFANSFDGASDIAIQANGKIVAAGGSRKGYSSQSSDFALARYGADGSLDTSFDADGKQTTSWLTRPSVATAVVVRYLISGGSNTFFIGYCTTGDNDDFAIADDFGGKLISPIGNSDDRANTAAVGPDRKVVAVGSSDNGSNSDFALVRYNGLNLDPTFDGDGKVTTDFGGNNDEARAVVFQEDGKIVVAGQTIVSGNSALAVARYNNNGSLDATFGNGGRVILGSIRNPKAAAIQADGKIIVAGSVRESASSDNFAIARFNPNGSLDTSFDGDGLAVTPIGFTARANSVAIQRNGRIVAAGYAAIGNPDFWSFALVRYNPNGSLDTSFDEDGKVTTSFGQLSWVNAVRVQGNYKIVAVGAKYEDVQREFALARYNPDGSLDTTFDTDGKQTTDFFGGDDEAFAATIQNDGRIITAGFAQHDGKTDFAAARYIGDAVPGRARYDFDGDGISDVSTFRPSNGSWYIERSTLGFFSKQFGASDDRLAPADYDGDGKTDIGVFRDGTWYVQSSTFTLPENPVFFGSPGDIPVPADYSGDGRAELTIYRNGYWWSLRFRSEDVSVVQFGVATDKPVPADYDGDGRVDQAVYRDGVWHLNRSTEGYTAVSFGLATDRPVPADYDGDSKADLAVYRDGTWYILQSTGGLTAFQFGLATDVPTPADYDGDGRTDAAVFRDGVWYLRQTASGFSIVNFGLANDKPIPSAFLR